MHAAFLRSVLLSISAGGTLTSFYVAIFHSWRSGLEIYGAVILALAALLLHAMRAKPVARPVEARSPVGVETIA